MTKTKNEVKKIVKEPSPVSSNSKKRKAPKYSSFKLSKRIKHPSKPIVSWWILLKKTLALINANKRQLAIFVLIYGLLMVLLVRGFASQIQTNTISDSIESVIGESSNEIETSIASFGVLITGSGLEITETTQLYQTILIIVASLAVIWLYRQQQAGNSVTIKMAFYRGMYPIIPFTLVLIVLGIQLIPALIGNFLFTTVISSELAVGALEQIIWGLLFFFTLVLSLYFISSSLIALYIVTLPEMTPMKALRQSRELVRYRRFVIIRKVFALLLICLMTIFVIVFPVIFFAPVIAEWIFFVLTIISVPFINAYLFSLYRELL